MNVKMFNINRFRHRWFVVLITAILLCCFWLYKLREIKNTAHADLKHSLDFWSRELTLALAINDQFLVKKIIQSVHSETWTYLKVMKGANLFYKTPETLANQTCKNEYIFDAERLSNEDTLLKKEVEELLVNLEIAYITEARERVALLLRHAERENNAEQAEDLLKEYQRLTADMEVLMTFENTNI